MGAGQLVIVGAGSLKNSLEMDIERWDMSGSLTIKLENLKCDVKCFIRLIREMFLKSKKRQFYFIHSIKYKKYSFWFIYFNKIFSIMVRDNSLETLVDECIKSRLYLKYGYNFKAFIMYCQGQV